MAAVSGGIPNLIGGVSQQPPEIRPINTAASLKNTLSDVSSGLQTRPCARYLTRLGQVAYTQDLSSKITSVADHLIQKPSGSYHISVTARGLTVTDLADGSERPLTLEGSAASYIDTSDPSRDIGFTTVGDTTFVFNRSKTVTAQRYDESGLTGSSVDGVTRRNPNRHSTIWVRQRAGYKANYAAYLNTSREALVVTDSLTPSEIASQFDTQMSSAGLNIFKVSETVLTAQLGSENDYISVHDDLAGEAVYSYNDKLTEFTKLPNFDRTGRLVLIEQSADTDKDDYWVWFKGGQWEETYGWDSGETLNLSTMPHVLFDNGDGTWVLRPHSWKGREVGSVASNPSPSFIGNKINHLFIYKDRLCVLAGENFIASQRSNFENFYRSTCVQLIDEDRIDIASSSGRGASLYHATEFNDSLLLFSALDQFSVKGDQNGLLSPNTVDMPKVNTYGCSPNVPPVYAGPNVVFVDDFSSKKFSSVREYQIDRQYGRQIAPTITDAVPEYIPTGITKATSSASDDLIVLRSSTSVKSLWVYNYYYNQQGKPQSSWQEWSFDFEVCTMEFYDDELVIVAIVDDYYVLLSCFFEGSSDGIVDNDSILLDLRVSENEIVSASTTEASIVNIGGTGRVLPTGLKTLITLPYRIPFGSEDKVRLVLSPETSSGDQQYRVIKPVEVFSNTLVFLGDLTSTQGYFIGINYDLEWTLNPFYIRDDSQVAIQDQRLQLRGVSFLYSLSGAFKVYVKPQGRDTYVSEVSGFTLGSSKNLLGDKGFSSGKKRVTAKGDASTISISVVATTPYRSRFSSIEWDGSYRPRRRRT